MGAGSDTSPYQQPAYPPTAGEVTLGVIPTSFAYTADPYIDPRRYGADPTGTYSSTAAMTTAAAVASSSKELIWLGANPYSYGSALNSFATFSILGNVLAGNVAGPVLKLTGVTTTGSSDGLLIQAGTNASDYAAKLLSSAGANLQTVRGDGTIVQGTPLTGTTVSGATFKTANQLSNDFIGSDGTSLYLASNAYFDGSAYRFNLTGTAAMLYNQAINSGVGHQFYDSATGTAGGTITWIERFRIVQGGGLQGYGSNAATLLDMTPDQGSFTGTLTGCTASVNCACEWVRIGKLVILIIGTAAPNTGTSNSTSLTLTGLPTEIRPANNLHQGQFCQWLEDNGALTTGACQISTSGTIIFYKGGSASGTSFTASGTKGVGATMEITYSLL